MKRIRTVLLAALVLVAAWMLYRHPPGGDWRGKYAAASNWLLGVVHPQAAPAAGKTARPAADGDEPAEPERADAAAGGAGADPGDDDEATAPSRAERVNGLPAVRMTAAEQQQTGVRVSTLEAGSFRPELPAAGRVIDIQPLLGLRNDFDAARAEQALARAALASTGPALARLQTLHREDANVSTRQVQEAQAQAAADAARVAAAERRMQDIRDQSLQGWGERLTQWAMDDGSADLADIVHRRDCLVMISLPPGEVLPDHVSTIFVGPGGDRKSAREARFISVAPRTDTVTQGETYFFETDADRLRTGMRMEAWIPHGAPLEGVEVPGDAVIWYAGRLWVYVERGDGLFVRRALATHHETRTGWFTTGGVRPGERVVVSGAQMLFSEEFRTTIPSEDDR